MSNTLKEVTKQFITNASFREAFKENPQATLDANGLELSKSEIGALSNLNIEDLEFMIEEVKKSDKIVIDVAVRTWSGAGPIKG